MGKSDVVSMPIEQTNSNKLVCVASTAQIHNLIYNITKEEDGENDENNEKVVLPENMEMMQNQVAGHGNDGKSMGMIKYNEFVLKPITKKDCGEREIWFYRSLEDTVDPYLLELRELVPKFYGTKTVEINRSPVDFIVLDDVTKHFHEPCIMDIKIGRRTWDPNSSHNKIMAEQMKYYESKRDVGFCIPGFQVYQISTGKFLRFDKEYGKTLNRDSIEDSIKLFLNSDQGFCRSLIVQFLASLWRIQHWARNQRRLRLYSSSILLVYDARRLREYTHKTSIKSPLKLTRKNSLYRPLSLAVLNNATEKIQTGFSGQLTKEGPILRTPPPVTKLMSFDTPRIVNNNNTWQKSMRSLKRTHSFQHDYDKDVQNKKQTYAYILDELCKDNGATEMWANAKMIDFAHVHHGDNCDIDRNYLDGIENLVKIFEEFLVESE